MATAKAIDLEFGAKNADSDQRLGELALYIAEKCRDDPNFGATKLNKILWWADFLRYGECGESITGAQYQALEHGPAPKRLMPVQKKLVDSDDAKVDEISWVGYTQKRLTPLREANISLFSTHDLETVNSVIDFLRGQTARQASEESHGRAWQIGRDVDLIPYEAVFLSDREPDEYDKTRAKQLARNHGW